MSVLMRSFVFTANLAKGNTQVTRHLLTQYALQMYMTFMYIHILTMHCMYHKYFNSLPKTENEPPG